MLNRIKNLVQFFRAHKRNRFLEEIIDILDGMC